MDTVYAALDVLARPQYQPFTQINFASIAVHWIAYNLGAPTNPWFALGMVQLLDLMRLLHPTLPADLSAYLEFFNWANFYNLDFDPPIPDVTTVSLPSTFSGFMSVLFFRNCFFFMMALAGVVALHFLFLVLFNLTRMGPLAKLCRWVCWQYTQCFEVFYINVLIAGALEIQRLIDAVYPDPNDSTWVASTSICYLFMIIMFFLTLSPILMRAAYSQIDKDDMSPVSLFASVFDRYKTAPVFANMYFFVYLLRRAVLVAMIVYVDDQTIRTSVAIGVSGFYLLGLVIIRPQINIVLTVMEVLNESVIIVIHIGSYWYFSADLTSETSQIFSVSIVFASCVLFWLWDALAVVMLLFALIGRCRGTTFTFGEVKSAKSKVSPTAAPSRQDIDRNLAEKQSAPLLRKKDILMDDNEGAMRKLAALSFPIAVPVSTQPPESDPSNESNQDNSMASPRSPRLPTSPDQVEVDLLFDPAALRDKDALMQNKKRQRVADTLLDPDAESPSSRKNDDPNSPPESTETTPEGKMKAYLDFLVSKTTAPEQMIYFANKGAVPSIINILESYPNNERLVAESLLVLYRLAERRQIGAQIVQAGAVTHCVATFASFPRSPVVQQHNLSLLARIIQAGCVGPNLLFSLDLARPLFDIMDRFLKDPMIQRQACMILRCLMEKGNRQQLTEDIQSCNGILKVLQALKAHNLNISVAKAACKALLVFSSRPVLARAIPWELCLDLSVHVMLSKVGQGSNPIQKTVIGLLDAAIRHGVAPMKLWQNGGYSGVVFGMTTHPHIRPIQQKGSEVIASMFKAATPAQVYKMRKLNPEALIASALETFPYNKRIAVSLKEVRQIQDQADMR